MIKFKNKLTITIIDEDETIENEQDVQYKKIKDQASLLALSDQENLSKIQVNYNILGQNNLSLNLLIDYMEGKNKDHDVSYMWLNNINTVQNISRCITFSPKSWETFFTSKNFEQEFKVSTIVIYKNSY